MESKHSDERQIEKYITKGKSDASLFLYYNGFLDNCVHLINDKFAVTCTQIQLFKVHDSNEQTQMVIIYRFIC